VDGGWDGSITGVFSLLLLLSFLSVYEILLFLIRVIVLLGGWLVGGLGNLDFFFVFAVFCVISKYYS